MWDLIDKKNKVEENQKMSHDTRKTRIDSSFSFFRIFDFPVLCTISRAFHKVTINKTAAKHEIVAICVPLVDDFVDFLFSVTAVGFEFFRHILDDFEFKYLFFGPFSDAALIVCKVF